MATIETERQALVALAKQFQTLAVSMSPEDFSDTIAVIAAGKVVDGGDPVFPGSVQPLTLTTLGALRVSTQDQVVSLVTAGPWGNGSPW